MRYMVGVLDLGVGQGCFARRTPVNRFLRAVDVAVPGQVAEYLHNDRFVGRRQGQVRIIPVAENAETLELAALDIDELAGESRVLFDKTLVNQESAKIGRLRERYAA
jgi:hypothetical protein